MTVRPLDFAADLDRTYEILRLCHLEKSSGSPYRTLAETEACLLKSFARAREAINDAPLAGEDLAVWDAVRVRDLEAATARSASNPSRSRRPACWG